ncbi:hypothetical protein H6F96_28725 [Microcoleus sp. FACHB-53]|jgi:hypothetical protein|nr:hypothetical protein [Microcoleus sp. FACHB-53]MBD2129924.1 hypothetical protein [Microcoleus sp. FACHB-1]
MNSTKTSLRDEVRELAEQAFHLKLISGYGDGQYSDEYQIVANGKPKHFPLERARLLLENLIASQQHNHYSFH